MAASKNHHYIPKSVLRQFCFEGESLLVFDAAAPYKGYRQKSIDRAFQKFHANTIDYENGTKSDHVERWLSDNIDGPLGEVLLEAKTDSRALLEESAKRTLARYLMTLLFRAPRGRPSIADNSEPFSNALALVFDLARAIGVEDRINLFGQGTPKDIRSALPVLLPTMIEDEHLDELMNSQLVLASPAESGVFCLSDFTMMRYDDPRNAVEGLMHEYWFVLSPLLAACFISRSKLKIGDSLVRIPEAHVKRVNFDFAMRSQFVAANCPVALHQTVRFLGSFPEGRNLDETNASMFLPGGMYC